MTDATTKQKLRERVVAILGLPSTMKINFSLGGQHIDASGFRRVAKAITAQQILVDVGVVHAGAAVSYDYDNDTLWLPNENYGENVLNEQILIVHECVHAFSDITKYGLNPFHLNPTHYESANEALAYVAQFLFLLYSVNGSIQLNQRDDVQQTALDIAKSIKDRPGAIVSTLDEIALRMAITLHPHYRAQGLWFFSPARGNGLVRPPVP